MNLETKITIYKFTPQLFTLTRNLWVFWRTWETAAVLVFYIIAETPKYSQL